MKKFWNFADGESGERTLRIEGIIAEESWINDEITPKQFRDELFSGTGDICVFVDSPGGDYFCAAKIYSDLREYAAKAGKVTIKIIGLAASAASVIICAGDEILIARSGCIMIHNPSCGVNGDSAELDKAKKALESIKNSLVEVYANRTKLSRQKIAELMTQETWFSSAESIKFGFADGYLEDSAIARYKAQSAAAQVAATTQKVFKNFLSKTEPPKIKVKALRRRLFNRNL